MAVVAQCYLEGVSTRRVEDVARALGIERLSKSQVSEMARSLDAMVETFAVGPSTPVPTPPVVMSAGACWSGQCEAAARLHPGPPRVRCFVKTAPPHRYRRDLPAHPREIPARDSA